MYDDDKDLDEEKEISAAGMHVVGEVDEAEDPVEEDGEEEEDDEDDDDVEEDEDEDE